IDLVVAVAAVEPVVASQSDKRVVAAETIDRVGSVGAHQRVIARSAIDRAGWRRRRARGAEDGDIARHDRRRALEGPDELRSAGSIAIGIVKKLAGAGVVDDA